MTKKKVISAIPLLFGVVLVLLFWKNTLLNIATHMHDWYDGAFMIWTMQNNIQHFKAFDFAHLFETNAMYPFSNTLSFTDHLFVPSFFALLVSFFSSNPLFQFNVVSILNHVAVYLSFYLFASRFTKRNWIKLVAALYGSFGPYFFSQFGHMQMIFMWPLVLSLYHLLSPQRSKKEAVLSGMFLGIQFLTGVYLGLIGLMMMGLYFCSEIIVKLLTRYHKKQNVFGFTFRQVFLFARRYIIIGVLFAMVAGISIYGYIKVNSEYRPVRDQSEFVTYSAHITDYFLVVFTNSWFNRNLFNPVIGVLNKHTRGELAGFVGLLPLLVIASWWLVRKRKKIQKIRLDKVWMVWCVLLAGVGFIFSLGPRMNWNGTYLVTPLPYWFVMKVFPLIAIMRAVSRWYFMVVFAVLVVMIIALDRLNNKIEGSRILRFFPLLVLIATFLEFYPSPLLVSSRDWKTKSYLYLQNICKTNKGAVLEFPFEYRNKANDIGTYLSLKTNTLMSSTLHSCPTLSGFSSFEPPLFKKWQTDFDTNGITDANVTLIHNLGFKYIKVNFAAMNEIERKNPESVIHTKKIKEVFRDKYSIVYLIIGS